MANDEQLRILRQGAEAWNGWRLEHPDDGIDLSRANLSGAKLSGSDLSMADLSGAKLSGADLSGADLSEADLFEADLSWAKLSGSDLFRADLMRANLSEAVLIGADLSWADLSWANLSEANLERATIEGCNIFAISAWKLNLKDAEQRNLIITPEEEPAITVDNLEVAQFIYLLLYNEKIRHVIDTITSKVVLILGRFTPERKEVLDAIREELRKRDYLPILFDFEGPKSRDLTETVSTLAHMARFIIADITDAKSIPAELQCIVPHLPSVPVQPLILDSDYEYRLFEHIRGFNSVLEIYRYSSQAELLASIEARVIGPAEAKANEIRSKIKAKNDTCP